MENMYKILIEHNVTSYPVFRCCCVFSSWRYDVRQAQRGCTAIAIVHDCRVPPNAACAIVAHRRGAFLNIYTLDYASSLACGECQLQCAKVKNLNRHMQTTSPPPPLMLCRLRCALFGRPQIFCSQHLFTMSLFALPSVCGRNSMLPLFITKQLITMYTTRMYIRHTLFQLIVFIAQHSAFPCA